MNFKYNDHIIMRLHFKNGTHEDKEYRAALGSTAQDSAKYYLKKWEEDGCIPTENGLYPYHQLEKVTFNNYQRSNCPHCGQMVYSPPEKLV